MDYNSFVLIGLPIAAIVGMVAAIIATFLSIWIKRTRGTLQKMNEVVHTTLDRANMVENQFEAIIDRFQIMTESLQNKDFQSISLSDISNLTEDVGAFKAAIEKLKQDQTELEVAASAVQLPMRWWAIKGFPAKNLRLISSFEENHQKALTLINKIEIILARAKTPS